MRPVSVAPRGLGRILNARQAVTAAQACAGYATAAGWTNNGSLVTASAVCVAESGGRSAVYYCNPTGQDGYYPPVTCPGIYDRGLWQLDSAGLSGTSDACAFNAQCNANVAYTISGRGTNFAPWAVYTSGDYTDYVSAAQEAVAALRSGTVASAVAGVPGARGIRHERAAIIGRCGTGARQQQWSIGRHAVRGGHLCVAVASPSAYGNVRLRWCDGLTWQKWTALGTGVLRNALSGECLADPGGSLVPGTQVTVAPVRRASSRVWWLP